VRFRFSGSAFRCGTKRIFCIRAPAHADSHRGITSEFSLCRLQARADSEDFSHQTKRSREGCAKCDSPATGREPLGADRRQLVVAEFARARARAADALGMFLSLARADQKICPRNTGEHAEYIPN